MGEYGAAFFEECWTPINPKGGSVTVADEAAEAVQDRLVSYGHPIDNHGCTASLWRTYLHRRYGLEVPIDTEDVCWLNVLQKISRHANERKRDNQVDVIGFTLNAELVGGATKGDEEQAA